METKMCCVQVGEEKKCYPEGTSLAAIAADFQKNYSYPIVLACENYRLMELHKQIQEDCTIQFYTIGDTQGIKTYRRSLCFLLVKAIHDVCKHNKECKVFIDFSLGEGYYCTFHCDGYLLNQEFLDCVKARMREMVDAAVPIHKRAVGTNDALKLFREYGMHDKEKLFSFRRVSKVNLYSMNEFEDYFYGYMVPDASYLKWFDLCLYDEGFILQMPEAKAPTVVPPFKPINRLFEVQAESSKWGNMLGVETVGDLNEVVTKGEIQQMILVQEALQEKKLAEIAQQIVERPHVKFILVAGPSSSGKTTFSHRLSVQLRASGLIPHPIAVDNYFVNREDTPRDEDGKYNYECLGAIDIEKFNQDLTDLLAGNEIELPEFNFKKGCREYHGNMLKLGAQDVLVIEGIHCLNDALTYQLPKENKFKIYISALTQLNIDEHNRIPSTDGRLLRRMVRDARTRGTSARETIAMWPSVRRGEEENIFPYQEDADVMFNSALIYELAVLKQYAEPVLFGIERDCEEYIEAKRLLKFLDYFVGVGSEQVPTNSLLKEFIGGGCFQI
ncbi:MAG: nucleoside kinase [Faecalimonas sp.]|nr:nucleoside kinase [Faecalimonas sp.]